MWEKVTHRPGVIRDNLEVVMNPHTYGYARGMSHAYAQVEQFLQEELNRLHELGSNGLLDDYIVEIADKMGLYIVRPREQENA